MKSTTTIFIILLLSVIFYGCKKDEAVIPTLTTTEAQNITESSVTTGGNITDNGGTFINIRGVCWSTSTMPTISDSKINSGLGTGQFTVTITGLEPATTYYIRAFATNDIGTAYGNQVAFTTTILPPVPTITFSGSQLWVHPTDNGTMKKWANDTFVITGATSQTDGANNTQTIVSVLGAGDYAAKICDELVAFGFSDWYLPSRDELIAMEDKKNQIGEFDLQKGYWSSTEYASYYAYIVYFSNGMYTSTMKDNDHNVRCVRKNN